MSMDHTDLQKLARDLATMDGKMLPEDQPEPVEEVVTPFAPRFPVTQKRLDPADTGDFCPTLPEPYEGLVADLRQSVKLYGMVESACGTNAATDANHAAAEAEHALRESIRILLESHTAILNMLGRIAP